MDNQNNQNGYTNFNNYQPTPDPNAQQPIPQAQPVQQQPIPQGQPVQGQPVPQGVPYQVPVATQQKDNSTLMGVLSIIFSVVSLFICPYIFAAVGIVCGISGITKNKKKVACWIGVILGILSVIINICYTVYMAAHPELQQQTLEGLKNILESTGLFFVA